MRAHVLELARGALAAIEAARGRIDDLNVYPVPDGDTGTNLSLTVRSIVEALEGSQADDRVGSRSRGLARRADGRPRELGRDPVADRARRGRVACRVGRPRRRAARAPATPPTAPCASRSRGRCSPRSASSPRKPRRAATSPRSIARGDDCVRRTRELLPALTEAGVVDAGAAGLVEILRGIVGALEGEPLAAGARSRSSGPDRRVGAPAALGVQVLHRLRRRGRPPRCRRARARARAARRLAARRRRSRRRSRFMSTPTIRAALSRSASRAGRSRTSRSRTCTSRRSSASGGSLQAVPIRQTSSALSSRSPPARGTAACSRTSAPRSSTAGRR